MTTPTDGITHTASEALAAVTSFEGVDATTLDDIARAAIRREYDAGQVVLLEGEPCAGLDVVQGGWLKSGN